MIDEAAVTTAAPGSVALASALDQLDVAAVDIGLESWLHRVLRSPRRVMTMSLPFRRDDGTSDLVQAYRVQHNVARGPGQRGIRYHLGADLAQTTALAMWMTWKCALVSIRFGGARGERDSFDPTSLSTAELAALTRAYAVAVAPMVGPLVDVPAPDVGTDSSTMARLLGCRRTSQRRSFAGCGNWQTRWRLAERRGGSGRRSRGVASHRAMTVARDSGSPWRTAGWRYKDSAESGACGVVLCYGRVLLSLSRMCRRHYNGRGWTSERLSRRRRAVYRSLLAARRSVSER